MSTQQQTELSFNAQTVHRLIESTLTDFICRDSEFCDEPDPCPLTGFPKKQTPQRQCWACVDYSCNNHPINDCQ
jgi:hypothetical protein